MSTAQLSAPKTAHADLALEAAVAARVLRTARAPVGLWQWLANPAEVDFSPDAEKNTDAERRATLSDPQLTAALEEIVGPLSARPHRSPQPQARFAAQWLAVACRCCAEQSSRMQLAIGPRLLAASLLPLYRCLATDDLCQGLRQTQIRLGEALALLAVCEEVGPALVEVLDSSNTHLESPHAALAKHFSLSLPHIAQLLSEVTTDFDVMAEQFSPSASQRLQDFDTGRAQLDTPVWATPELLWKLAGELTSERSELKLPRSWIDISLPWNQIVDHWNKMQRLLSRQPLTDQTSASDNHPPNLPSIQTSEQIAAVDEESTLATVTEIAKLMSGNRPTVNSAPNTASAELSADRGSALPKVVISEIQTHNDPSFVEVIRRQIAKCRSGDRALSLVSLVVLPEDATHRFAVYENGLSLWQQKLVGWLSDHPAVVEPHAFLTSDGELLLCILDLERNETTALLRHGLVEVLTGQRFDDNQRNLLAEVDAPARYHAGIASTSSPGARFLPEQLIDPAIRCLSAARRHGKASIKSIEVY